MTELQQRVRDYISVESRISSESIDVDTSLISSGLVDSFAVIGLVAFLEETMGVAVPGEYVTTEHLDSLSLIEELIQKLKQ